jgi:hypothetical protein
MKSLDAERVGNETRYMNHTPDANAVVDGKHSHDEM